MPTPRESRSILLITLGLLAFGSILLAYAYGFLGFPAITRLDASIIKTGKAWIITEDLLLNKPFTIRFTYPSAWNVTLTCPQPPERELSGENIRYSCHASRARLSMILPQPVEGVILSPLGLPIHHLMVDDGTRHTASYLPRGVRVSYQQPYTPPQSPFPIHAFLIILLSLLPFGFWYVYGREKPVGSIGVLKAPPRDDRKPWELDVLVHHTLTPRGLLATLHWMEREGLITYRGTDTIRGRTAFLFAIRPGKPEGLAKLVHDLLSQPDGETILYIAREGEEDIIAFLPEERARASMRLKRFAEQAEAYIHSLQERYYKQGKPVFAFLLLTLISIGFLLILIGRLQEAFMLFGYSGVYTLIYALSPPSLFRSFREDYYHEFIEWLSFRAFLNTPREVLSTPYVHHVDFSQWFEYALILGVEQSWLSVLRSMHEDVLADEYATFIREYHPFTLALGQRLFRRLSDVEDVFLR